MKRGTFCRLSMMLSALLVVGAGGVATTTRAFSAAAEGHGSCRVVNLPIALAPGSAVDQSLHATICMPQDWGTGPQVVATFAHGATYTSAYWNWPINSSQYSAVADTLNRGWATVTFDEIGAGLSSHPPSTSISIDTAAYALHQVLIWERSLHRFQAQVVIGHSVGSATAADEASTWNDEDALVLTGYSHFLDSLTDGGVPAIVGDFTSANTDPACSCPGLDAGYLTTVPGTRADLFFDRATADPTIIAYDEAHPDVVSATEFAGTIAQNEVPAGSNISNRIQAPVLEVIGEQDALWCGPGSQVDCTNVGAVKAFEQPYFSAAARFDEITIPDTGHDLALHPSALTTESRINDWVAAAVQ